MSNYKVLSHRDHVLKRPDTYVGSVVTRKINDWVFDQASQKMIRKETAYNQGLVKIIFEAIDNAIDNSKRKVNPTTTIKVTMDDTTFSVYNDGAGIPIRKEDLGNGELCYIPTTIFGVPMSGSNFDGDRNSIGMNGLGVKIANILSSEFKVVCIDKDKKFTQVWKNNMADRKKESITKAPANPSYTTMVSFKPDLKYFHGSDNECNIKSLMEISDYIYTRLLTVSVSHPNPIRIYFNGKLIKCKGIKAYMKLFTDEKTFYETVPGANFEYGVTLSSTGSFEHQSFVNCQRTTSDKSSHTKYVTNQVLSAITAHFKKKNGGNVKLTNNYIANYLHVFVNIHLLNPKFTSQTKTELTSNIPAKKFPIDKAKVLGVIKKSGLLARLESALESKVLNNAQSKLNSTKQNTVNIPKLDDAHNAGTTKSGETMLFLVEGDSAKTMVSTGMSVIGRKNYGVFPLKGKVLNVIGATPTKLSQNKEITNIMKILGLNFNKKYNTEAERKSLRYGRLCILCDSDVDGMHITGLLITFINHFWPALLTGGFLKRFVTPIIKVTKGKTTHDFFTTTDYNAFAQQNNMSGWTVKHLKGLGTSKRSDNIQYFKNMERLHLKDFKVDDMTSDLVKNIFDPSKSNWRKDWLIKPMEVERMNYNDKVMNVSRFLNTEMHDYSSYNIKRAVASAVDGLKVSQRKALFACLEKFKNPNAGTIKVAQLAAMAAAMSNYAHGEVSLQNTIVNMAQSFSGSNNLPYLYEDGAFGTRIQNGNDAASPRYIFTKLTDAARAIITETSPNVLNYLVEENMSVEPEFYVPALPMALVNGANGIATGFRSLVPMFKPLTIVNNIRSMVGIGSYTKLVPWYDGTYKTNHKTKELNGQWVFEGQIDKGPNNTLVITELPIGVAIDDYKDNTLSKMVEAGVIKKFVVDHVSENEPKFIIHGYSGNGDLYDRFKLKSSITMKCMNLLDRDGRVRSFTTPDEIFHYWYDIRKEYMEKSRQNKLKNMREEINEIDLKMKFIKAVVTKQLEVRNVSKSEVTRGMTQLGIPEPFHAKFLQIPIISITKERYDALGRELENINRSYKHYESLSYKDRLMAEIPRIDTGWSSVSKKRKLLLEPRNDLLEIEIGGVSATKKIKV